MHALSRPAVFRLASGKERVVKRAQRAQEAIVGRFSRAMLAVMANEASRAMEAMAAGQNKLPALNLSAVDRIAHEFLIATVREAFSWARHQRDADLPAQRTRMAKAPKADLPPGAMNLPSLFRNRKAWDVMVKRNRDYAKGIKRAYLKKLAKHFEKTMPKLLTGEITVDEAKQNLEKAVKATGPRVETIFRTETTKYFTDAQINYFDGKDDIIGWLFDSVRDASRTKICSSRHGMVLLPGSPALRKNKPACHFNCRSHLIPLADTPENRKLMKDPLRQPENRSLEPLPRGWRAAA